MRTRFPTYTLALLALAGLLSPACDSHSSGAATASGDSPPAASQQTLAPLPKDGDPTVVAELRKVAGCTRKDGVREDCAAGDAWDEYSAKYVEEDDLKQTKAGSLARACLSLVADTNDNVREAAMGCVASTHEAVEDKRSAIAHLTATLESEKTEAIRSQALTAIDALDAVKHGGAPELLALARKLAPRDGTSGVVRELMDALTPAEGNGEPDAATISFAVTLVKDPNLVHRGTGASLLGAAASSAATACPALLELIQSKKYPWAEGLRAMSRMNGACSNSYDAVVKVVVEKMAEPEGYDKGLGGGGALYLVQLLEKPGFTADQKSKLLVPAEKLAKTETKEHFKETLTRLVATLKQT